MNRKNGRYHISTDKTELQIDVIHDFLGKSSYWAKGIPRHIVEKAIQESVCFGIYEQGRQIGFARLITDQATFAYLADVFILESHRGKGLGKWLISVIMEFPGIRGIKHILLATANASAFYAEFGFKPLAKCENMMEIKIPDIYWKNT